MTNEEAIESFKHSNEQAKVRLEVEKMRMDSGEIKELEFYIERDEMAIKALEQEPKMVHRETLEQVMWERNVAIEQLKELGYELGEKPKTGHWIKVTNGRGGHECDICHEYAPSYQSGDEYLTKYCPNCGARMVEPQERSE